MGFPKTSPCGRKRGQGEILAEDLLLTFPLSQNRTETLPASDDLLREDLDKKTDS